MRIDVTKFGVIGDNSSINTQNIQKLIGKLEDNNGGELYFPSGVFLTGTLHLCDDITIVLSTGATLKGSPNDQDFDDFEDLGYETYGDRSNSFYHRSILHCEGISNVTIKGEGKIHSNRYKRGHIKPIAVKCCDQIEIKDITIENAMDYAISMLDSEFITVNNIKILNGYADGIDFDNCRFVRVSNCYIDSWDDAICLKSSLATGDSSICENITITNCTISSSCNCFKMGTESSGTFKHITFSNSVLYTRPFVRRARSGIAIESVDGADVDDIAISNISIQNVLCPIFIRLGNRGRGMEDPEPGTLQNVSISNVVISNCSMPIIVNGLRAVKIQTINLSDIVFNYSKESDPGKYDVDNPFNIPENEQDYPDPTMFGTLPSWALFLRYVDGNFMDQKHIKLL